MERNDADLFAASASLLITGSATFDAQSSSHAAKRMRHEDITAPTLPALHRDISAALGEVHAIINLIGVMRSSLSPTVPPLFTRVAAGGIPPPQSWFESANARAVGYKHKQLASAGERLAAAGMARVTSSSVRFINELRLLDACGWRVVDAGSAQAIADAAHHVVGGSEPAARLPRVPHVLCVPQHRGGSVAARCAKRKMQLPFLAATCGARALAPLRVALVGGGGAADDVIGASSDRSSATAATAPVLLIHPPIGHVRQRLVLSASWLTHATPTTATDESLPTERSAIARHASARSTACHRRARCSVTVAVAAGERVDDLEPAEGGREDEDEGGGISTASTALAAATTCAALAASLGAEVSFTALSLAVAGGAATLSRSFRGEDECRLVAAHIMPTTLSFEMQCGDDRGDADGDVWIEFRLLRGESCAPGTSSLTASAAPGPAPHSAKEALITAAAMALADAVGDLLASRIDTRPVAVHGMPIEVTGCGEKRVADAVNEWTIDVPAWRAALTRCLAQVTRACQGAP